MLIHQSVWHELVFYCRLPSVSSFSHEIQGWSEFHNGKGWLGSKRSLRSAAPRAFALWGLEDSTPATLPSFPTPTT